MNQDDEKKKEAVGNMLAGWFGKWADAEPTKPTQSSNNGWISVYDKLPPNNTPVLIYLDDDVVGELGLQNNITIACYDNGHGDDLPCWLSVESQNCSSVVMSVIINPSEVAYWQALPELPQKKTKRTLVLALLADNYPFVLVHKETYALRLCDETIIDELNLDDYFIDCKITGQTIIDYVDGKVIFEPSKEQKITKINQSAKLAKFKCTEIENAGVMITALNSDDKTIFIHRLTACELNPDYMTTDRLYEILEQRLKKSGVKDYYECLEDFVIGFVMTRVREVK